MDQNELDKLNKMIRDMVDLENRRPHPEMDNLSPRDMSHILYNTFGEGSPVRMAIRVDEHALLDQVPFFKLFIAYLDRIEAADAIKLTPKGNLPVKLCRELYDLGIIRENAIEKGYHTLNSEEKSLVLQTIKILGMITGITKKRQGQLSLTGKGKKLLADRKALFETLFHAYYKKYNWGYHDGYPELSELQHTFGYPIYLLIRYGKKLRPARFYSDKVVEAFPQLLDYLSPERFYSSPSDSFESLFSLRLFQRFFEWFGFVKVQSPPQGILNQSIQVQTSPIFRELFTFDPSKLQGIRSGRNS